MKHLVKIIRLDDTLEIRHAVLKPFLQNKMETIVPGDSLPGTFHLGCFVENKLVAVGSFMPEFNYKFTEAPQFRLRQMATSASHLRQGCAKAILQHGMDILAQQNVKLLWFDAREKAFPFYLALGFEFASDFYQVPQTGPHKLMYKKLSPR